MMRKFAKSASGRSVAKPFVAALALVALFNASQVVAADNPEPGRQGEILPRDVGILPKPYTKGVHIVGHSTIFDRAGNVQLAWVDQCAYVASTIPQINLGGKLDPEKDGVAVIDVANPEKPRELKLLRTAGSIRTAETIHAVTAGKRKVLVAGAYAGGNSQFGPKDPASLDIYDASDCRNPKLVAQYVWPQNAHTVTISPDGRYVVGTAQDQNPPFTGHGGLMVLDISDMKNPKYLGKFGATASDGRTWEFSPHEISFNADGSRIYAAVTDSTGDDLNPGMKPGFSLERLSPEAGGVYIFDSSDLIAGRRDPKLRLVGTVRHGGWHSVMPARIGGVPYLVGGGELVGCPGAVPKLSNIADETHPYLVSEFRLQMNHSENCPTTPPGANPMGAPSATLHFNDVDSATNTRLGLFNFTVAGMRIADLRDPLNPVEVAYFRPGDFCTGHARYLPRTGNIWLTCFQSGFWVIKLDQVVAKAMISK